MSFSQVRSEGGSFSSNSSEGFADLVEDSAEFIKAEGPDNSESRRQKDQLIKKLNFYRPLKQKANSADIVPTSPPDDMPKLEDAKQSSRYRLAEKTGSLNMPVSNERRTGATAKAELGQTKLFDGDKAAVLNRYFNKASPEPSDKENTYKASGDRGELRAAKQELTICLQRLADSQFQVEVLEKENSKLKAQVAELKRRAHDDSQHSFKRGESPMNVVEYEAMIMRLKAECAGQKLQLERLSAKLEKVSDKEAADRSLVSRLDELEAKLRSAQPPRPSRKPSPAPQRPEPEFKEAEEVDDVEINRTARKIRELEGELYRGKRPRRAQSKLLNRSSKSRIPSDAGDVSSRHSGSRQALVGVVPSKEKPKQKKYKKKRNSSAEPRSRWK